MKKIVRQPFLVTVIMFLGSGLISCSGDKNDNPDMVVDCPANYEKFERWYSCLINTSWQLQSSKTYYSSGEIIDNTIPLSNSNTEDRNVYAKYLSAVITLTPEFSGKSYTLLWSTGDGDGRWWITDNQELALLDSFHWGNPNNITAAEAGIKTRFFPSVGKIDICTSDKLVLIREYSTLRSEYVFKRIYGNSNTGGSETGGASNHHYPCKSCDESGKCWNCNGKGIDGITNRTCNTCHGTGKCQICQGRGYVII